MAMLAKHIETKGGKKNLELTPICIYSNKYGAHDIFKTFAVELANQEGSKMNSLRTNRGSEISSSKKKFYKNYVMHNEIALYIPKQNRVTNN